MSEVKIFYAYELQWKEDRDSQFGRKKRKEEKCKEVERSLSREMERSLLREMEKG